MFLDQAHRLADMALRNGAIRHSVSKIEWDIAGSCEKPALREFFARPSPVREGSNRVYAYKTGVGREITIDARGVLGAPSQVPLWLLLWTRCRVCLNCMIVRRASWRARAEHEIRVAARTWFGTFTLAPENHELMANRARLRLLNGGTDFECLTPKDQFGERHREIGKELTKYFKRIRKNSGAALRYLLVSEEHKSGLPHYHALLHEAHADEPVSYRELTQQWQLGFTKFKLVADVSAASYVCKYIVKAADTRIRASLNYGKEGIRGENRGTEGSRLSPSF